MQFEQSLLSSLLLSEDDVSSMFWDKRQLMTVCNNHCRFKKLSTFVINGSNKGQKSANKIDNLTVFDLKS